MASRRQERKPACASTTTRKRRRLCTTVPEAPVSPIVVLEVVARSDTRTLIRCAALCKSLRRHILSPAFLRSVTRRANRIVPPCLLGYLHTYDEENPKERLPPALFSLVHPSAVPAAVSFSEKHLAPFVARSAAYLLGKYKPVTSRGGLVLLRRRNINRRKRSERRSDMCVYNPMTGERTFFSTPPDIGKHHYYKQPIDEIYVLLTAADGIGCSFMLLAADFSDFHDCGCIIGAQTLSSDGGGTWAPITYVSGGGSCWWGYLEESRDAVVLHGGVIYWLAKCDEILTYQVSTLTPGSIKLPVTTCEVSQLHLGQSPEGRLRLLVADGFTVSVWLLSSGNAWELKTVMDREDQLRLLDPKIPPGQVFLQFRSSGERSGVALLRVGSRYRRDPCGPLILLDVETGNMRRIKGTRWDSSLIEVDMSTRLQAMKTFT